MLFQRKEVTDMAIRVMIKRWVTAEKEKDLVSLITELRSMVSKQPGYISGETMRHVSNPDEYLVISTWDNLQDWEKWVSSPPRKALQDKIDKLLGKKTTYDIYHYPEKRYHKAEPSDYLERTPSKAK
jgi:heme oxygenase (mycobilin-producing)